MRFDEVELQSVPFPDAAEPPPPRPAVAVSTEGASLFRRLLALVTDLSLFVALALALSPLLPATQNWTLNAALGGFVLMTSYYYFVGAWLLWGKTVGGAIFDVRVVSAEGPAMSFSAASARWAGVCLSLLTG
ncbi:MAG TPA: RDD family protein, partial [Thermoanaerobaculia bacterium]|nr:RDD family protein [Thermoanaerobaculia bacterium]